ncbi:MAG: hypothetical protein ABI877_21165, partial [Gemmatimonadaceae bacterium]
SEGFRAAERESPPRVQRVVEDVTPRKRTSESLASPAFTPMPDFAATAVATAPPIARATPVEVSVVAPRGTLLEINAIVGAWDDLVDTIRRERPTLGSMLEHCLPTGVSASGTLTLLVDNANAFDSLTAKAADILTALRARIPGLAKINLRALEGTSGGPARMSHETMRSDTMASLRKRDPLLRAAIDELDLALLD